MTEQPVEQTEILALTRNDLTALRNATSVSFHVNDSTGPVIKAWLRDDEKVDPRIRRVFPIGDSGLQEHCREIVVTGSVRQHGWDPASGTPQPQVGFAMIHTAQHVPVWQTVASSLRAGDRVHLSFGADRFSNEYSRRALVHTDALTLLVQRRHVSLEYLVQVSTCRDNSARMCRPAH